MTLSYTAFECIDIPLCAGNVMPDSTHRHVSVFQNGSSDGMLGNQANPNNTRSWNISAGWEFYRRKVLLRKSYSHTVSNLLCTNVNNRTAGMVMKRISASRVDQARHGSLHPADYRPVPSTKWPNRGRATTTRQILCNPCRR